MTPRFLKLLPPIALALILALAAFPALAQIQPVPDVLPGGGPCGFAGGPPCTGATTQTIIDFADSFISMALALIGTLAVIFLVYAGFKYISSRGDEEEAKRAKMQVAYAVVGIIIALSAYVIKDAIIAPADPQPIITQVTPFIDMAQLLVGTAAVIYLVYAAFKYISSRGDEEEANRAKAQIAYAIIGIVVALSVYTIRDALIVPDTTDIRAGRTGAVLIYTMIAPLYVLALYLVGTVAGIFLIYAGFKYIASQGDEEQASQAKRQIVYAIIGLSVFALAYAIVVAVAGFPLFDMGPSPQFLLYGIRTIANRLLALVGTAAAIFLIYAGVKYITSGGDEETTRIAKAQIIYAVVGLLVIFISFAIVNLVMNAIATSGVPTFP